MKGKPIIVRVLKGFSCYNMGDVAGFSAEELASLPSGHFEYVNEEDKPKVEKVKVAEKPSGPVTRKKKEGK